MQRTNRDREIRTALLKHHLKLALPGVLLIAILVGGMIWSHAWKTSRFDEDVQGVALKHGIAVVISVGKVYRGPYSVALKVEGKTAYMNINNPVQIGQRVQAQYRIGRSGTVYFDHIQPLPNPLPGTL